MTNKKNTWRFIIEDPSRQEWYQHINEQGNFARDRHQEIMDQIENRRHRNRNEIRPPNNFRPQMQHVWDTWGDDEVDEVIRPPSAVRYASNRVQEILGRNNNREERERRIEERERELRRREVLVSQRENSLARRERAARDELLSHERVLKQTAKLLSKTSAEAEPEQVIFSSDKTDCAICTESYEAGAKLSITPCKHMFHEECLNKWKESKRECPLCQKKF